MLKKRKVDTAAYEEFMKKYSEKKRLSSPVPLSTESRTSRATATSVKDKNAEDKKPVYLLQRESWVRLGRCQHCEGNFRKGIFGSKCKECGRSKDYSEWSSVYAGKPPLVDYK